jgi:hypothetical protein
MLNKKNWFNLSCGNENKDIVEYTFLHERKWSVNIRKQAIIVRTR